MSDVPLFDKKANIKCVETNKSTITFKLKPTNTSRDFDDLFYEADVKDALRKFRKDVLKHKRIKTQHFSCDGIWVMDILKLIEKRFGVLDLQNDSNKGCDSP